MSVGMSNWEVLFMPTTPRTPTTQRVCSIARALEIVGEKWSLLAIREAFQGVGRFNEIQANTGAPRDILTDRLRKLEEAGLLNRVAYQDRPPRFEYRLTAPGHDLFAVVTTLREWGDRHFEQPPPVAFTHKCGNVLESKLVCVHCEQDVTERNVRVIETARTEPGDRGA